MSTLNPKIPLTNPQFHYINSSQTDIRETFRRFSTPKNQEINKPLVPPRGQSLEKPLVQFLMIPDGFVLPVQWMEW
jgi:hypothetical protein